VDFPVKPLEQPDGEFQGDADLRLELLVERVADLDLSDADLVAGVDVAGVVRVLNAGGHPPATDPMSHVLLGVGVHAR
jgi:hypothetical protein